MGAKKGMTNMSQSSFGVSEIPICCIHFVEATTSLTSRCHYYPMESFEILRLDPISWKPGWLRSTFHMDYHDPYLFFTAYDVHRTRHTLINQETTMVPLSRWSHLIQCQEANTFCLFSFSTATIAPNKFIIFLDLWHQFTEMRFSKKKHTLRFVWVI